VTLTLIILAHASGLATIQQLVFYYYFFLKRRGTSAYTGYTFPWLDSQFRREPDLHKLANTTTTMSTFGTHFRVTTYAHTHHMIYYSILNFAAMVNPTVFPSVP
jgi:hypothetical protein